MRETVFLHMQVGDPAAGCSAWVAPKLRFAMRSNMEALSVVAPLIDHCALRSNVRRRAAAYERGVRTSAVAASDR